MEISLVLDVLIAVLLITTIGYAVSLNKKLGDLRRDKSEMEDLARRFGEATARADESVKRLRTNTDEVAEALKEGLDKAEALREDLNYMIERGLEVADALKTASG